MNFSNLSCLTVMVAISLAALVACQGGRKEVAAMTHEDDKGAKVLLDKKAEAALAAELFNYTWTLLDKKDRTSDDDLNMIHAAHASRFHWGRIGTIQNWAVGEWQVARVYCVLKRTEPAQYHAQLALKLAIDGKLPAFYLACGHEAMARAALVAGDKAAFQKHWQEADRLGKTLTDKEEIEVLYVDLNELKAAAN